jgi:hypothetical protein
MCKNKVILFSFILLLLAIPIFAEEIETGWISGQIMIKGDGPMSNGMVVFFNAETGPPPAPDKYLRIPDEVGDLDEEGKFRMELPVGKYYMGAIKRMSGEQIGPPQDGDYFFISRDQEGIPVAYIIEKGKSLSVGVISEAVPFKRTVAENITGISGTITDLTGKPVEGAIVFAYITETMTGLPPFTSYRTGPDGKYLIRVDKGGKYYLRVRDVYGGGPPVAGAVMGGYGEEAPVPVEVKTGEVTQGIDIKVIRHLEIGPKGRQMQQTTEKELQQKMEQKMQENIKKLNKNSP